jgi:urease accessory protein
VLKLVARARPDAQVDAELALAFESRQRSRLLTALADGEPVTLLLERGSVLRGGDCLAADDGRIVRIVAADEDVMDASSADPLVLVRVAYHLGNRHARVEIGARSVRFAADPVLATMARGLGAEVVARRAPFEPEAGAYAAGHHHHSGEAKHAGIIHEMLAQSRRG